MTAVPTGVDSGVLVICDTCATTTRADSFAADDGSVVHVSVAAQGWSGSTYVRGPHRCAACTQAPRPRPDTHGHARSVRAPSVTVASSESSAIVAVRGDVHASAVEPLRRALSAAVTAHRHVVIDLSAAGTLGTPFLAAVLHARNVALRRNGEVVLAGASRRVTSALAVAGAHGLLRIFRNTDQAKSAVARDRLPARRTVRHRSPQRSVR